MPVVGPLLKTKLHLFPEGKAKDTAQKLLLFLPSSNFGSGSLCSGGANRFFDVKINCVFRGRALCPTAGR
jgi:hypothetical protein